MVEDKPETIEKPITPPLLDAMVYVNSENWGVWIGGKEHKNKGPINELWSLDAVTDDEVLVKDQKGNILKLTP